MLDHVSIPVSDLDRAAGFYDAVLAPLGLRRHKERPGAIGYGPAARAAPVFWILTRVSEGAATPGIGVHVSFQAPDRASVDAFHEAALRCNGRDAGRPGCDLTIRCRSTAPSFSTSMASRSRPSAAHRSSPR